MMEIETLPSKMEIPGKILPMTNPLLVRYIDFKVAKQNNSAESTNALLAATKFPGFHIAFHDINAVFLIEGHAGDFVEANHVVLTNEAALAARHIDEHARDGGLAPRKQVGVGRDLLKKMTLAGTSRA